jgi:hypothetical protein
MNKRVPQIEPVAGLIKPVEAPLDRESVSGDSRSDAEVLRRRDIATLLGGAIGAFALSACTNEARGGQSEAIGQAADALSGAC